MNVHAPVLVVSIELLQILVNSLLSKKIMTLLRNMLALLSPRMCYPEVSEMETSMFRFVDKAETFPQVYQSRGDFFGSWWYCLEANWREKNDVKQSQVSKHHWQDVTYWPSFSCLWYWRLRRYPLQEACELFGPAASALKVIFRRMGAYSGMISTSITLAAVRTISRPMDRVRLGTSSKLRNLLENMRILVFWVEVYTRDR